MKWRATFEGRIYHYIYMLWFDSGKVIPRVIEKEDYDRAVIYANAMVGESVDITGTERLGRLMFIEVASDDADLNENCRDLRASQERAERIFNERSGRDVIEAMKRFEALGF